MSIKKLFVVNLGLYLIVALTTAKPTAESNVKEDILEVEENESELAELQNDYPYHPQIRPYIPSQDCSDPGAVDIHVVCLPQSIEIKVEQKEEKKITLYVEGYRRKSTCRKEFPAVTNSFLVHFGTCGLELDNNKARYNLIILRHDKIDNGDSSIHDITCHYPSKNATAATSMNVEAPKEQDKSIITGSLESELSHEMYIVDLDGKIVQKAKPGTKVVAIIAIKSKDYKASVKNCQVTTNNGYPKEYYAVTGKDGCSLDVHNFGQWQWHDETRSLQANFKAFKFPENGDIKLECDVIYCYPNCPPLNCTSEDPCQLNEQRKPSIIKEYLD